MGEVKTPDLAAAEVYVEAAERPVAGGTWYVLPDDRVIYQRPNGAFELKPVITADALRSQSTWKKVER